MSVERESPLVTFYRFFPNGRPPQPADRSAVGTMPTRAFRYCEAMTSASAFGWYLFPPMRFSFVWDGGTDVIWNHEGTDDWYPLTSAQYPNFVAHFNSFAPEEFRDYCPPFLAAFKEPGIVQIWTGLVGLFVPFLLFMGAIRLARPDSPWARGRYKDTPRRLASLEKAKRREERFRRPIIRAKIRFQELLAGRPDKP